MTQSLDCFKAHDIRGRVPEELSPELARLTLRVGRQAWRGHSKFDGCRLSALQVVRRQHFFPRVCWDYFKRFVWRGERTIFER